MRRHLLALAALSLSMSPAGAAEAPRFELRSPAAVDAKAVVVMDMANGDVLYASNADAVIPPASLTKIMTMDIALGAVAGGGVRLDDRVRITKEDATLPYRSSLMYLSEGMNVRFDDLLRGMCVISGNDAAMTVARVVAGSPEAFAELMNAEAERLGLEKTRFVEPSGLSELNTTTALEMARLARAYLLRYPEALSLYHGRTSMEFPRADVMPTGVPAPAARIILRNRNDLLFSYSGCDGLKTGYIDESGYNLVATAERAGTRFIVVTLGGVDGPASRKRSGAALLDWAFANWKTVSPELPELPSPRAWGGARETVELAPATAPSFTVPAALAAAVSVRVEAEAYTDAPVAAGAVLGRLVYTSGDRVVRRIDLVAKTDVPLGNILVRMRDAILRFFTRLFS